MKYILFTTTLIILSISCTKPANVSPNKMDNVISEEVFAEENSEDYDERYYYIIDGIPYDRTKYVLYRWKCVSKSSKS